MRQRRFNDALYGLNIWIQRLGIVYPPTHPALMEPMTMLAGILLQIQRFDEALSVCDIVLQGLNDPENIHRSREREIGELNYRIRLTAVLALLGSNQQLQADAMISELESVGEEIGYPEIPRHLHILGARARLCILRGESREALDLTYAAVKLAEANPSRVPPGFAVALLRDQVTLASKPEDIPGATTKFKKIVAFAFRELEPDDSLLLDIQAMYASLLILQDAPQAVMILKDVHRRLMIIEGPDDSRTQIAEGRLAWALSQAGELEEALATFRSLRARWKDDSSVANSFRLLATWAMATILHQQERDAECLEVIKEYLHICEGIRASAGDAFQRATQAKELKIIRASVVAAICTCRLNADPAEVLELIESAVARSLLDVLEQGGNDPLALARQSRDVGWWTGDRFASFCEAWDSARLARDRFAAAGDEVQAAAAFKALRASERSLRPFLAELTPISSSRSAEEIRGNLRAGELMIVYAESQSGCVLVAIPPLGAGSMVAEVVADLNDHVQFQSDVRAVRCLLNIDSKVAPEAISGVCERLFPTSVRLLAAAATSITIAATGDIRTLPIDYVAERGGAAEFVGKPIQYAPSASAVIYLRQRAQGRVQSASAPVVALVGDVDYGTAPPPPLPWTAWEVADVLAIAGSAAMCQQQMQVRTVTGQDAHLAAVRDCVTGATVAVFATHGDQGSEEDPSTAYLIFAPADYGSKPTRLTLHELVMEWGNRLKQCHVVVLSACWSDAPVDVGGNAWALTLGFLHAGAQCVVASITPVTDVAGWLFTRRFFENLTGAFASDRPMVEGGELAGAVCAGHPAPPAIALAEARQWIRKMSPRQLAREMTPRRAGENSDMYRKLGHEYKVLYNKCRTMKEPPFADPCHWAGYRLVGDGI